jgi:hypothetical protein
MKNRKWNFDLVSKEALKYQSQPEFQSANLGAYLYAWKNNILGIICKHMKERNLTYH